MYILLDRIKAVTDADPHSDETLLMHCTEELGELAAAITIEDGVKRKPMPKEPSKVEAVDLLICALSMYYRRGGTTQSLDSIISKKLSKWEQRLGKENNEEF